MIPPKIITQGDTLSFDVPATSSATSATHTLNFSCGSATGTTTSKAGVANGSGWRVSLTPSETAGFPVGKLYYSIAVSKTGERFTIEQGEIIVEADFTAIAPIDGRSQAEVDLAAVQAEIRARAGNGATLEYSIGNRSLKRESITVLITLENKLRADVAREKMAIKIAKGIGSPRNLYVRFNG
jgi:hypothetical protein